MHSGKHFSIRRPDILSENIPDNPKLKITEINQQLPVELQAVKGRGKYKGKIVKRAKPIKKQPVVVQQTTDESSDSDSDLKSMILNELSQSTIFSKKKSKPIPIPREGRTQKKKQPVYTTDTDYTELTTDVADDDETQSE